MLRRPLEAPEPQAEARKLGLSDAVFRLHEGMSVKLEHDLADLGVAVRGEKDGIEFACRLCLLLSPGCNGEEADYCGLFEEETCDDAVGRLTAFKHAWDKDACPRAGRVKGHTVFTRFVWASVKDTEEKLRGHRQGLETLIDRKLSELKDVGVF